MMGEELNSSYVTERGLLGDRTFALVDRLTGKVASAKNPLKWGRLFDCRASFVDSPQLGRTLPGVRISLPDGNAVASDQLGTDDLLSKALGAQVNLTMSPSEEPTYEEYWPDIEGRPNRDTLTDEFMPPHTFFDLATLHLLTTATMDRLRELYPEGRFEARRFRPNLVVENSDAAKGFAEEGWIDRALQIGEVRIRITRPCSRCVMTTLAQGDLPQDLGILRTAARYSQAKVGVYASVEKGGRIRRGDSVWVD